MNEELIAIRKMEEYFKSYKRPYTTVLELKLVNNVPVWIEREVPEFKFI
jgi:hypothetical protein